MPTSSDELRQKFGFGQKSDGTFEDGIGAAEDIIIKHGGTVNIPSVGMIKVPDHMNEMDAEEMYAEFWDAVDFLCEEWDYAIL